MLMVRIDFVVNDLVFDFLQCYFVFISSCYNVECFSFQMILLFYAKLNWNS